MLPLLLNLDKVVGLVQVGLTTFQAVRSAIITGRMTVHDADGRELSAADVEAACVRAQLAVLQAGDHAAARLDARHGADGTGEP